jgi:CelD/BcsL family acetyltransferase involved in cellulose biosynthesis
MDPLFGKLRPGKLSIMTSIQFAIAQGCQSLALLHGNETYKARYRATSSACYNILLWPDRIAGSVGYTLDYTNSRLRYYARIGRYLVIQC